MSSNKCALSNAVFDFSSPVDIHVFIADASLRLKNCTANLVDVFKRLGYKWAAIIFCIVWILGLLESISNIFLLSWNEIIFSSICNSSCMRLFLTLKEVLFQLLDFLQILLK